MSHRNHKTIRQGDRNWDVKAAQTLLNQMARSIMHKIEVDGIFGPRTHESVVEFQERWDLQIDGIVGRRSWEALYKAAPGPFPKRPAGEKPISTPALVEHGPKAPVRPVAIYLHATDVLDAGYFFDMHKNQDRRCFYLNAKGHAKSLTQRVVEFLDAEGAQISCLVINSHGSGGGRATLKGKRVPLTNFEKLLIKLRPYFLPRAEVRIYACLFASAYKSPSSFTAHVRSGDKESVRNGPGIEAMKRLARVAKVPVLAGFRAQEGLTGEFLGPYARVNSSGAWSIHQGRKVSAKKEVSYVVKGILEDTAAHLKKIGGNLVQSAEDPEKAGTDFVTRLGRILKNDNARFL